MAAYRTMGDVNILHIVGQHVPLTDDEVEKLLVLAGDAFSHGDFDGCKKSNYDLDWLFVA
jgi:hypothetical protein